MTFAALLSALLVILVIALVVGILWWLIEIAPIPAHVKAPFQWLIVAVAVLWLLFALLRNGPAAFKF